MRFRFAAAFLAGSVSTNDRASRSHDFTLRASSADLTRMYRGDHVAVQHEAEQLGREDASITDLADKFHMSLTGMKKHVGILEQAGLVATEKVGRVRTCRLGPHRLKDETAWLERYCQLWDARFDELEKVVQEMKRKEKAHGRKQRQ